MNETTTFLITGILFGLTAGISPGPLLTLVISETLKHNKNEGIKVAIAPLLTDIPIITVTLFALSRVSHLGPILGTIAVLGGIFVAYLGYESITTKGLEIDFQKLNPKSIRKGIIVNALSPHPYLFWLTVGAPITFKAYQVSLTDAIAFISAFYVFLVGSKIAVALLIDRSKAFLQKRAYIWTMRLLGTALFVFAALFIKDGLKLFGIF